MILLLPTRISFISPFPTYAHDIFFNVLHHRYCSGVHDTHSEVSTTGRMSFMSKNWRYWNQASKAISSAHSRSKHAAKTILCCISSRGCNNIIDGNIDGDNEHLNKNLKILKLPVHFLKNSDEDMYDPSTGQRNDVNFDASNGKPIKSLRDRSSSSKTIKNISFDENKDEYTIEWENIHKSTFSAKWIDTQLQRRQHQLKDISNVIPRLPWTNLTEEELRSPSQYQKLRFSFNDLVTDDIDQIERAVTSLYQYGLLFITSTPINDNGAGVAAIASALSGPQKKLSKESTFLRHYLHCIQEKKHPSAVLEHSTDGPLRTMFGNVWFTNSSSMSDGVSVADSSYSNGALPLHTDFTYYRDPPGLQIFTMVSPANDGGESIYADGLAIAEYMRSHHSKEFDTLCRIRRRYRSIDNVNGWFLEGRGTVFEAIDELDGISSNQSFGSRWGPVISIRHNDLDRLPDLPPQIHGLNSNEQKESDNKFYEELERAHKVLDSLLARDQFRLTIKLNPGETVAVVNNRCLHGRYSFKTSECPRSIMGCYVGQDDLESRFRWMMQGDCTFQ